MCAGHAKESIRHLVACGECQRQFDATELNAGDRFHCHCGKVVKVPQVTSHDSRVVRCSACGGPRDKSATHCGFCGAGFTLNERDLHTLCPGCMTRVPDSAKFCHGCGGAIIPDGNAGEGSDLPCPACNRTLHHRKMGEHAMLECPGCAGLWINSSSAQHLIDGARNVANSDPLPGELKPKATAPQQSTAGAAGTRTYRKCPHCETWMNRRNFGKKSGIILDHCQEHGVWFDLDELDGVLDWIRKGGEVHARRQEAENSKRSVANEYVRGRVDRYSGTGSQDLGAFSANSGTSMVGELLGGTLVGVLGSIFD